jgi:hypothetical protein
VAGSERSVRRAAKLVPGSALDDASAVAWNAFLEKL